MPIPRKSNIFTKTLLHQCNTEWLTRLLRYIWVLKSFSASPKHSMDWSSDQTQTPTVFLTQIHTHTQACTGIQGLWWIIYLMAHHIVMHPFISAAAEQTVERWEASLQGWQKVLIHERAGERHWQMLTCLQRNSTRHFFQNFSEKSVVFFLHHKKGLY